MKIHVLPGDSLLKPFGDTGIEGETVVFRECLVDGPCNAASLEEFWQMRADYLEDSYGGEDGEYAAKVTNEMTRLWNLADGNEVYFWFEYELFCQVNFWFCVWLLRNTEAKFSIVYPAIAGEHDIWKGFGHLDTDGLRRSFEKQQNLNHDDILLAVRLWEAFQKQDYETLLSLGESPAVCFPTLDVVTKAACEIETRPLQSLRTIVNSGKTGFGEVFQKFCDVEGVYGFGDLQVKRLFDGLSAEA